MSQSCLQADRNDDEKKSLIGGVISFVKKLVTPSRDGADASITRTDGDDRNLGSDKLTLLTPIGDFAAGKTYCRLDDGTIKPLGYGDKRGNPKHFRSERIEIRDLHDFISMLESHDDGQMLVMGRPIRGGVITKRKQQPGAENPGLADQAHRIWINDIDKIPNLGWGDPTKSPAESLEARNLILSLFPPEIANADRADRFSSSSCVTSFDLRSIPDRLGMHVAVWVDSPQNEEVSKLRQKRVNAYVQRRLEDRGLGDYIRSLPRKERPAVDSRVSTFNQPIYISRPKFQQTPGSATVSDPFPGAARHQFVRGLHPVVSLARLDAELDADEAAARIRSPVAPRDNVVPMPAVRRPREIRPPLPMPAEIAEIIDFAAYRASKPRTLRTALMNGENDDAWTHYAEQCRNYWNCGIVGECIAVIREKGGLDHRGSDVMTLLTSLALKPLPLDELSDENILKIMTKIAISIMKGEAEMTWFRAEWLGMRKYVSIVDRARRTRNGEVIEYRGRYPEDPRYGYGKRRVIEEIVEGLDCEAEVMKLGLTRLMNERMRSESRRRADGAQTRAEYLAECHSAKIDEMRALVMQGIPRKEIARSFGTSAATVSRLLKYGVNASPKRSAAPDATSVSEDTDVALEAADTVSMPYTPDLKTEHEGETLRVRPTAVLRARGEREEGEFFETAIDHDGVHPVVQVQLPEVVADDDLDGDRQFRNRQDFLLHAYAGSDRLDAVLKAIAKGADVNSTRRNGRTVLHEAAQFGSLDVSKFLISAGVDVNAVNNLGDTPLHIAVHFGHADVAKVMISAGIDVNVVNNVGNTSLHAAVCYEHSAMDENLKFRKDSDAPLHAMVEKRHVSVLNVLISNGADVNATNNDGNSPLHLAARYGSSSLVEFLAFEGADVNARNAVGDTPLHEAARYGQSAVAEFLISESADVNAANGDGDTPLQLAAAHEFCLPRCERADVADELSRRRRRKRHRKQYPSRGIVLVASHTSSPWEVLRAMLDRGGDDRVRELIRGPFAAWRMHMPDLSMPELITDLESAYSDETSVLNAIAHELVPLVPMGQMFRKAS